MKSLIRFIFGLLRRQAFGLAILACAAVSFSYPEAFLQWGSVKLASLVVPAVQLIMLGMGTTVTLGDFIRVAKNPCTVAIGVFLQFLVMPAVGFLMAKMFGFSGELAAGCVLVGSVAGGTASNVIAYLAGANVALSVSMTCCSTLLSPFATPLLMKLLAGQFVAIDATAMVVDILKIVLVPVAAGCAIRRVFSGVFERRKKVCDKALSTISMVGICFTILALTAPSRHTFASAGFAIILAAMLHNSIGYLSGYWLTRLLGQFLPFGEAEARTVAIEVGMQNGGMAGALAMSALNSPVAALPANVFSIWMNFSGSVIAERWRKRPVFHCKKQVAG
jgi:BASS family bile acid:Na+ symporter